MHLTIYALIAAVFMLDLLTPPGVAVWLLYLLPIALSSRLERPRAPILLTAACTGLTALGYAFSPSGIDPTTALLNRAMGVSALWAVALSFARGVRARAVLRESEARFRTLVESSADGMFITDATGRTVDANAAGCAMLGYTREEMLRLKIADVIVPGDRGRLASELAEVTEGRPYLREWLYLRKDGTTFPGEVHAFVLPDGRVFGVLRDITVRQRAEGSLKRSKQRLRDMIDGLGPNMLAGLLTPEGIIVEANRPALEVAGLTQDDVLGRPVEDTYWWNYSTESQHQIRDAVERAAHGEGSRYDAQVRVGENSFIILDFSIHPLRNERGDVIFLVASGSVITERKRAEAALRESEGVLRLFAEESPAAIAMLDHEMRYLVASRRWRTDYGLGDRPLIGHSHYEVFPEIPERWKEIHRRCLAGATERCEEDPFLRADGTTQWLRWAIQPWYRADGGVGGIVVFSEDITERKSAEEALQEMSRNLLLAQEETQRRIARDLHDSTAQKLTALGLLLGRIAGEPIGDRHDQGDPVRTAEALAQECARELRTVSHLLHPPLIESFGIGTALADCVAAFIHRSGIQVTLVKPPGLGRLPKDTELCLYRIVQEGLGNIQRHSGSRTAQVELSLLGDRVVLEIRDQGKGIPEPQLKDILERRRVSGLGLFGMQERLRQLGGELEVDSTLQGTTIRAILPLKEARA